ncbi:MAG TPA: hypothetical protein VF187_05935, partial [Gemmatimonadales bacterium]
DVPRMIRIRPWICAGLALVVAGSAAGCGRKERVDPTADAFAGFGKRVEEYVALRNRLAEKMGPLDETKSQAEIAARAATLASLIEQERATARQGDLFSPDVAALIATLIKEEYRRRPDSVRETRGDAQEELPDFTPRVNMLYPTTYPLATFPPSLLPILPPLPKEVEYRIVERYLVLRDVEANVIVDYMPNAVPEVH